MNRLEDKVAIITGGASGLGEAAARKFASHGAYVTVADVQDELGRQVCSQIGDRATYIHCDVSHEEQVQRLVQLVAEKHGRLDVILNNAGIGQVGGDIRELDMDGFDRVLATNVRGVVLGMKYAARVMVPARAGCIINMASAVTSTVGLAPYSYTASKHAVVGLTKTAAVQLGQFGIRANCISPGPVMTPMFVEHFRTALPWLEYEDIRQIASGSSTLKLEPDSVLGAEDVANAAIFLASDESRFMSGHNLMVDGASSITDKSFETIKTRIMVREPVDLSPRGK